MRKKQVLGIKTGDRIVAIVPEGFAAVGTHKGRIAVRANKQFRMGKVQGIPARFCRKLQQADGYDYVVVATTLHLEPGSGNHPLSPKKNACFLPMFENGGICRR